MSYDAAQVIATLPANMRVSLTNEAGQSATVGRASISSSIIAATYGDESEYQLSYWFDVRDFATAIAPRQRVTVGGVQYYVLAVFVMPGNLRRLDLGGKYGR